MYHDATHTVNIAAGSFPLGESVRTICNTGERVCDIAIHNSGVADIYFETVGMRELAASMPDLRATCDDQRT